MKHTEDSESHEEHLKKMIYFSREIAKLQTDLSFAQLKQIQGWLEKLSENQDDPEVEKELQTDPFSSRFGLLLQSYIANSHCPVCTTVLLVAAFLHLQLEAV